MNPAPKQFYYQLTGTVIGPMTGVDLRESAFAGNVTPTTLVANNPRGEWVVAGNIPGLFDENGGVLPHPPEAARLVRGGQSPPLDEQRLLEGAKARFGDGASARPFYYQFNETIIGPVNGMQLREASFAGKVVPTTLVANSPNGQWMSASSVRGLFDPSGCPLPPPPETLKLYRAQESLGNLNQEQTVAARRSPRVRWYCWVAGTTLGPFSHDQLAEMVRSNRLRGDDYVKPENSDQWILARQVAGLGIEPNVPSAMGATSANARPILRSETQRRSRRRYRLGPWIAAVVALLCLLSIVFFLLPGGSQFLSPDEVASQISPSSQGIVQESGSSQSDSSSKTKQGRSEPRPVKPDVETKVEQPDLPSTESRRDAADEIDAISSDGSEHTKPIVTSKETEEDDVKREIQVLDVAEVLKLEGYPTSQLDMPHAVGEYFSQYIRYGSWENAKRRKRGYTKPWPEDQSFLIRNLSIHLAEGDSSRATGLTLVTERFWLRISGWSDSESRSDLIRKVTVNNANNADIWFLTKSGTLKQCRDDEVDFVLRNNGILYLADYLSSEILLFLSFGSGIAKEVERNPEAFVVEIVVRYARAGRPRKWGYYRFDALTKHDWDCSFLRNWNRTGVAGKSRAPYYFQVDRRMADEHVSQASLVAVALKKRDGTVVDIATTRLLNGKLVLPTSY